MAASTTTLLQAANTVLLSINERPLSNLSTVVGQQVRACLSSAMQTLMEESNWTWLESTTGALSWDSNGRATLDESIQRVRLVQYREKDLSWDRLRYLDADSFDELAPEPFTAAQTGSRPCYYTLDDWNQVRLSPYPTDPLDQAKVRFKVIRKVVLPAVESDVLECPEHFIQALIKKAAQEFALRHAEDTGLSQMFGQGYEQEVQSLRNRHRPGQTNSYSMYKGSRNRE
jgi:hypothetical protein